jgi:hypothetical protein
MTLDRFINAVKGHAGALDQGQGQPRFATVASFDPQTYTARVTLQPEGVLSGWLPVLASWIGGGWGMVAPPAPGDQVLVIPQEGQAEHGVIVGRAFSDQAQPPQCNAGELLLMHKSGSFLKLASDGTVQVKGDLHVAGDVYDKLGSLSRLRTHYDGHTHVDSRGGTTSTPNQQD